MRTARELTLYFMRKKNEIVFQRTGIFITSDIDQEELESFTGKQFSTFMDNLVNKRTKRMKIEDLENCRDCFSKFWCNTALCPYEKDLINDSDICSWCRNISDCDNCKYGWINMQCHQNISRYKFITNTITEKFPDLPMLNRGIISNLPEMIRLTDLIVYDYLTGEEIIGNEYKDDLFYE